MTLATTENPVDLDQALEAAVEMELREFVRRDGATRRRTPETDNQLVANNIATLFEHMAGKARAVNARGASDISRRAPPR